MARRERGSAAPEVARIFLVRPVAPKYFLQDPGYYQSIQQRLRSKHPDLARFRIIPPGAVNVCTTHDGNQGESRTNIGTPAPPLPLPTAVFKRILDMRIGGD